jgi:cytidylate kinase
MRPKKIIITIDGFSSCGKSTLAKDVAQKLKYRYIDTGAMYRSVTKYFLENDVQLDDEAAVEEALSQINIDFDYDDLGKQITILNKENVELSLRSPEISNAVSHVAALKIVRTQMVAQQQLLGKRKGIIMDGRDIGTVVFPKAELKIFLIAKEDIRVDRRYQELLLTSNPMTREEVRENLLTRDHIDSTRKESPLKQAEDAIVLDNSYITPEEQTDWVIQKYISIISTTKDLV